MQIYVYRYRQKSHNYILEASAMKEEI